MSTSPTLTAAETSWIINPDEGLPVFNPGQLFFLTRHCAVYDTVHANGFISYTGVLSPGTAVVIVAKFQYFGRMAYAALIEGQTRSIMAHELFAGTRP